MIPGINSIGKMKMIECMCVQDGVFSAIPYIHDLSFLNKNQQINFSTKKPNIIVGPNGSGKSSLIDLLSLRFLCHFTKNSALDYHYINSSESDDWWTQESRWGNDYVFLKGLDVQTDGAPALRYRPGHIPGNEDNIATALCMGYTQEARSYAALVDKKSAGQKSMALLHEIVQVMNGVGVPEDYLTIKNWRRNPKKDDDNQSGCYMGSSEYKARALTQMVCVDKDDGESEKNEKSEKSGEDGVDRVKKPLILMDEPEQSLDALNQMTLWKAIAHARCDRIQVIATTHSLYPLLHPESFNLIETVPGYVDAVLQMI
jgi:energy-coupling factor transporter ATP-binding protein EcfA2